MIKKLIVPAVLLTFPLITFGASGTDYLSSMVNKVSAFVTALIPVTIAIALLLFLIGLVGYIGSKDDAKKKQWKNFVGIGIVILFVMTAVWGLVAILADILNVNPSGGNYINAPRVPGYRN